MKAARIWATLALLVSLPMHARCAEVDASNRPLTAAEREQCHAQVIEFNEKANVYNAKVAEIRALRAEIEARRAELDTDTKAVDRNDAAAMDALDARILKNNDLIARHAQLTTAAKEMAEQSKQFEARFHDACDNRASAPPEQASPQQPSTATCSSTTGAKDLQERTQAALAEMREDEKRHQAEVDAVADARAKAQSWSKERQGQIWLQVLGSPRFKAFEREKQPYSQELMRIVTSRPRSAQEECHLIQRIGATLPAIKAINAREYAFMADEFRAAK